MRASLLVTAPRVLPGNASAISPIDAPAPKISASLAASSSGHSL